MVPPKRGALLRNDDAAQAGNLWQRQKGIRSLPWAVNNNNVTHTAPVHRMSIHGLWRWEKKNLLEQLIAGAGCETEGCKHHTVLLMSNDGTDDSWIRRTHGLRTANGTAEDF
jgi:hypothetical protein